MIRPCLFLLSLVFPFIMTAQNFSIKENVPYDSAFARCCMDIYHPNTNAAQLPVVIWFHGGGLTGGNKFIPQELMTGQYVVVAPNYRLMPDAAIEDCIDDAAKAVAWAMHNAEALGGRADQIFVAGHSAGGYLASMVGLDKKWLNKYGVDPDSLAGIIPYSGQAITHFAQRRKMNVSELTPMIDDYAPLFHIRKDAPPYIIITGDRELELFGRYEENAYMYRMLKLMGHPNVYIYELDGYNHGDMATPAHHILKNHITDIISNRK